MNEEIRIVKKKNQRLQSTFQVKGQIKRVTKNVVKIVMKIKTTIELPIKYPGKLIPYTTLILLFLKCANLPFQASSIFVL